MKHFTLRIDENLLRKLHFAAAYKGRSANSQILMLIKRHISEFENLYGVIELNGR
ncbi:MAG: Arc family DNA-binding protein [Oscillospiraceae bacterium]|nr:Arc family DNA-binding protein [Oscillospiraceae bacterium]